MIHLGTSGYSYDDWVGHFYPEGTGKRDFLSYYAEHFGCVEVNYTYYACRPRARWPRCPTGPATTSGSSSRPTRR